MGRHVYDEEGKLLAIVDVPRGRANPSEEQLREIVRVLEGLVVQVEKEEAVRALMDVLPCPEEMGPLDKN
jgi:hypothetical protein